MKILTTEDFNQALEHIRKGLETSKNALDQGSGTRDKRLRKLFFETCREVLIEKLGMSTEAFLGTCFVEGFNKIPGKKPALFGSKVYPDAVIKLGNGEHVAIELDWGNKGSKLRNALAKAGMLNLIGNYAQIILFFLVYPAQAKQKMQITELEQKVLKFYEEELSTKLIIL